METDQTRLYERVQERQNQRSEWRSNTGGDKRLVATKKARKWGRENRREDGVRREKVEKIRQKKEREDVSREI